MTPRTIQKSNITEKLDQAGQTKIFIIEEALKVVLNFLQGTVRILQSYFILIYYQYIMIQFNILNKYRE